MVSEYNLKEALEAIAGGLETMDAWEAAHDVYVPSEYLVRDRNAEYIAKVALGQVTPMSATEYREHLLRRSDGRR